MNQHSKWKSGLFPLTQKEADALAIVKELTAKVAVGHGLSVAELFPEITNTARLRDATDVLCRLHGLGVLATNKLAFDGELLRRIT